MAKTNIIFNNKNYQIDSASLDSATAALRTHLSTVMNGSGETVNLGGTAYNIDATKLATVRNAFVSHLGTIAGSGHKVMVNGVEYGIDSTKLTGAISDIEVVLAGTGEERLDGDGAEYYTLAPTALSFRSTAPLNELQEIQINGVTVDPSNYTLGEGSTIVTFPIEYLKTLNVGSYEVAVASDSKTVKGRFTVAAPELNEYGFYYNQPYVAYVDAWATKTVFFMRENGTADVLMLAYNSIETCPYAISGNTITLTAQAGTFTATINADGIYCNEVATNFVLGDTSIAADEDYIYTYKEDLGGYEVQCIDKTKVEYGAIKTGINGIDTVKLADEIFYDCGSLKSIEIPASVTIIGTLAFHFCTFLTSIIFNGTVEQWNAITFGNNWNLDAPATYVQCSDGQVAL